MSEEKEFTTVFDERVYGCVSGQGDEISEPLHCMADIVVALDSNADNVSKSLKRLMADGHVVKVLRRYYTIDAAAEQDDPVSPLAHEEEAEPLDFVTMSEVTPEMIPGYLREEPETIECPFCPHPLYMHKDGDCLEDGCDCGTSSESQSTVTDEASEVAAGRVEGARSEERGKERGVEAVASLGKRREPLKPEPFGHIYGEGIRDPLGPGIDCPCYWFWNSSGEARFYNKHHPECDGKGNRVTPRIGDDNICPRTNKPCDDETCPPGAECNLGIVAGMTDTVRDETQSNAQLNVELADYLKLHADSGRSYSEIEQEFWRFRTGKLLESDLLAPKGKQTTFSIDEIPEDLNAQPLVSHTVRLESGGILYVGIYCDLFKAQPRERDLIEGIVQLVQAYELKKEDSHVGQ